MSKQISISRWVVADLIPEIESALYQWQQAAQKSGCQEPVMRVADKMVMDQCVISSQGDVRIPFLKRKIELKIPVPCMAETSLLARITHHKKDDGYSNHILIPKSDKEEAILSTFPQLSEDVPHCDHCGSSRHRKHTYLVERENNIIRIAEGCLADALSVAFHNGVETAFNIARWALDDTSWQKQEREFINGHPEVSWYPVLTFLKMAIHLTRTKGFIKSDLPMATRDEILSAILHPEQSEPELTSIAIQLEQDQSSLSNEAAAMLTFYRDLQHDSAYIGSLQGVLRRDFLKLDNRMATGVLASAPSSYYRAVKKQNNQALNAPFGKIKERGPIKLHIHDLEDLSHLEHPAVKYRFRDDQGRKFTWRASGAGRADLVIGKTVILNATIKGHTEWKGQHYTLLTRCSDFNFISADTPAPDFHAGATKRAFKETYAFQLKTTNSHGSIDGVAHLHIHRSWRENKQVREYRGTLPLPLKADFKDTVLHDMATSTGVSRKNGPIKKDAGFLGGLDEASAPFLTPPSPEEESIHLVDDAYAPLFCHDPLRWGRTSGTPNELAQCQPRLFFRIPEAERHGKQLHGGRLTTLQMHRWSPMLVPISLRREREDKQNAFKSRCAHKGFNVLTYVDDNGIVKRMEPISWSSNNISKDYDILNSRPIHRPFTEALELQSSRLLQGRKYVVVSGLTPHPARATLLRESLRKVNVTKSFETHRIVPDILSPTDPNRGGDLASTPLRYLASDESLEQSSRTRLMVVSDSTTAYYLRNMGADVVEIMLIEDDNIPVPTQATAYHYSPESLNSSATEIFDTAVSALNNPNRDWQRAHNQRN